MVLLAIDTAQSSCSAAVAAEAADGTVLFHTRSEARERGHAERLMALIEAVLAEAGAGYSDIDRIAVTVGPGSFTGVRVGLAAARGLALVTGAPVAGISVLQAVAEEAGANGPVAVALDARRGQVYCQVFAAGGEALTEPAAGTPEDFARTVGEFPGAALAGSGADLVAAHLKTAPPILSRAAAPAIEAVARLGLAAGPVGRHPPAPLYLRAPDAKPQAAGPKRADRTVAAEA